MGGRRAREGFGFPLVLLRVDPIQTGDIYLILLEEWSANVAVQRISEMVLQVLQSESKDSKTFNTVILFCNTNKLVQALDASIASSLLLFCLKGEKFWT